MGIFDIFKKAQPTIESESYQAFSSPFGKVPETNLALPNIDSTYSVAGYVYFGVDNLYPQLINQMYYSSPLHSAIVDFKVNATLGGGFELDMEKLTAPEKVKVMMFKNMLRIKDSVTAATYDLVLHKRAYFLLRFNQDKTLRGIKYVCAAKVRTNKDKSLYKVCDDWRRQIDIKNYTPYHPENTASEQLFTYECPSVGQDVYPIPSYTSAMNYIFSAGEMSYLNKANLQNSIFPAFAMMFPKKPQTEEEKQSIRDAIGQLKGADNAGKTAVFFSQTRDHMPELVNIPKNSNENLFKEASDLNVQEICFAHTIDPILMGVRTTGALGNGSDIKQSYIIFEKNNIIPLRETVEGMFNELLQVAKIPSELKIFNYQIINEKIVEMDEKHQDIIDKINILPDALKAKVIESMTPEELRKIVGL